MFWLRSDTPLLPLTRAAAHLPAFWVNSSMFHRICRLPIIRVCSGPVWGGFGSGGGGPGPPFTTRFEGCALRPGAPLAPVPLRTPRAARRAAFTHSGHFELTLGPVRSSYLHLFGFLEGFSRSLHWLWLDNFCGWHFYFKVTLLSPASVYGTDPSSSPSIKRQKPKISTFPFSDSVAMVLAP